MEEEISLIRSVPSLKRQKNCRFYPVNLTEAEKKNTFTNGEGETSHQSWIKVKNSNNRINESEKNKLSRICGCK